MKITSLLILLTGMLIIGSIFGLIFHMLVMPLYGNSLIHCIFTGVFFGFIVFIFTAIMNKQFRSLKKSNKLLNTKATIDNLTGLYNRRSFDDELHKLHKIKYCDTYSMIFIDIDNFREFNNNYGHQVGDMVLKKVGLTIKNCIRLNDKAYRYGGEEIVILLEDCEKMSALKVAEKIRRNIFKIINEPFPSITISSGVSSYPEDGYDSHDIVKACDEALLTAKSLGKNQTYLYCG